MAKRDVNTLRSRFQSVIGRDPTSQDIRDFIDPATGRIWGGLYDNLDSHISQRKGGGSSPRPSSGSGGGHGGGASSPPLSPGQIRENQMATAQTQVDITEKFGDRLSQHFLDNLKEFGPQFAGTQKDIIDGLYPEQSQVGENAAGVINSRLTQGAFVPEELKKIYRQFRLEADSSRGLENSGLSAEAESLGLAQLAFDIQQRDISSAISLNAGVPKPALTPVTPGAQGPVFNDYFGASLAANTNLQIAQMQDATRNRIADNQFSLSQSQLGFQRQQAQPPNPFGVATGMFAGEFLGGLGDKAADSLLELF